MARYTGPKARVSRRLGTNVWGTKGENAAMEKRPYPPGMHGRTRRRGNVSEYLLQMQEKQKARFTYGLSEKQFRRLYEEASRREGVTGESLLRFCEQRLDNVVYRAGWAATRPQARQFVSHGHVEVNGKRANTASIRVRKGDVITGVDGQPVGDASDLVVALRAWQPGERVVVTWHRGVTASDAEVVLGG